MHSYILSGFTNQQTQQKISSLVKIDIELNSPHPDIHIVIPTVNQNTVNKTQSIKIQDVRKLISKLSQQPLKLPFNLAIIQDAHFLTTAAQNSFLKLLEEAPNSHIFLITQNINRFLPTIKSRCQIILNQQITDFKIKPKFEKLFKEIEEAKPISRLKLIESYEKTLSGSQELVLQFTHIVRELIKENSNTDYLTLLKNLQTAHSDLSRNINRKLILDHLCLNWNNKLIK